MIRATLMFTVILLLAIPVIALSETLPSGSRLDHRVREARYVDGQVYVVKVALTRATTIEFEPGETIVSIVAGDTEAFKFEGVPGGRVFAIKPTANGVETNVTVYTTQRSYYFRLITARSAFYTVRFKYPSRKKDVSRAVAKAPSNTSYGVSAKTEITPQAVWDDGAFTYFKFDKASPIPAIFKVTNGLERSVNSNRQKNGVMRVSGTSRQWALRLGAQEVCIAEMAP